jgi:hypothetical protein
MVIRLNPVALAIPRVLQWVWPRGVLSKVRPPDPGEFRLSRV